MPYVFTTLTTSNQERSNNLDSREAKKQKAIHKLYTNRYMEINLADDQVEICPTTLDTNINEL